MPLLHSRLVLACIGLAIGSQAAAQTFSDAGDMAYGVQWHTATLLSTGEVLVAAGFGGGIGSVSRLYNPVSSTWTETASSMNGGRWRGTGTLLPNDQVLLIGGYGLDYTTPAPGITPAVLSSTEIYNSLASGAWSYAAAMSVPREHHTATVLSNGLILVAGGDSGGSSPWSTAEFYNPTSNTWTSTASMGTARTNHTGTLLQSGKVLVAGGNDTSGPLSSAELFDPGTATWSPTGALVTARYGQTTTLLESGWVLIMGGTGAGGAVLSTAELYDPNAGKWRATSPMAYSRYGHTATTLQNGVILVVGGLATGTCRGVAEAYDFSMETWAPVATLNLARGDHTSTLLNSGEVLVAGGDCGGPSDSSSELFTPATSPEASYAWGSLPNMPTVATPQTATLLNNGLVLIEGLSSGNTTSVSDLYDPSSGHFTASGALTSLRNGEAATLLQDGRVLVSGGDGTPSSSPTSELYDPTTGTWTRSGTMTAPYALKFFSSTLLPNGKVLVAGGYLYIPYPYPSGATVLAEIYDPNTGSWYPTGSMTYSHDRHGAVLLPDGRVLVAGGSSGCPGGGPDGSEIYDPATGTWGHAACMLAGFGSGPHMPFTPGGLVLAASGQLAETYALGANKWKGTSAPLASLGGSSVRFPDGLELYSGRPSSFGGDGFAEFYNPASGTWFRTVNPMAGGTSSTMTLLPNGQVLATSPSNAAQLFAWTPTAPVWTRPPPGSSTTGTYTLAWASPGATSFWLQRQSASAGTWTTILNSSQTTYSERMGDGTYFYRVLASNPVGASGFTMGGPTVVTVVDAGTSGGGTGDGGTADGGTLDAGSAGGGTGKDGGTAGVPPGGRSGCGCGSTSSLEGSFGSAALYVLLALGLRGARRASHSPL